MAGHQFWWPHLHTTYLQICAKIGIHWFCKEVQVWDFFRKLLLTMLLSLSCLLTGSRLREGGTSNSDHLILPLFILGPILALISKYTCLIRHWEFPLLSSNTVVHDVYKKSGPAMLPHQQIFHCSAVRKHVPCAECFKQIQRMSSLSSYQT